ncbi:hypothetical protein Tco_0681973 [Tanacetum coccineum]|uniref:Uncharacterized protein n=1 Tax=Tanacetum coccineum TaxID=301880 RepID=A0ABQ4XQ42_9ASTR
MSDSIGGLVSLGDEIFLEGKESQELNIGGGTIAGRAIITWGGGIVSLISESEGMIVDYRTEWELIEPDLSLWIRKWVEWVVFAYVRLVTTFHGFKTWLLYFVSALGTLRTSLGQTWITIDGLERRCEGDELEGVCGGEVAAGEIEQQGSLEGFLPSILLLVMIIVAVVIVAVILVVVVVAIVGVVIVVMIIGVFVIVTIIRVVVVVVVGVSFILKLSFMIIAVTFPSMLWGSPQMKASISFSEFDTMFGHKTANSWNLLTLGDPISLFYSDRLGVCIPPGQGIIGQGISLGPVFLLGLLAFSMAAAYPTDEDGDIGVSVSLGDEIYSDGKKSQESSIVDSDNTGDGGKTAGRAIITWGGGIAYLISESEGTIVE